jgi:hypothetical protein
MTRRFSILLAFALLVPAIASAQNLRVFYFAPTATMNGAFGAANTQGLTRTDSNGNVVPTLPGYRYILLSAANRNAFNGIAAPNMRATFDSLMNANSRLKRKINQVLSISGNKVRTLQILLVDDRTGTAGADPNGIFCLDSGIIWPCADNWQDDHSIFYTGRVRVGEQSALLDVNTPSGGGFARFEATLIHEVSHTQFLSDTSGVNKWGKHGIGISYGGDQGHWFEELQADEQQAMDEGLASFWGLAHNPPMADELSVFLNRKDRKFLLGSHSFLTGIPEMWNSPHGVEYSGPASGAQFQSGNPITLVSPNLQPGSGYELRTYKWLDVPGQFALYNEMMSESYFFLYHRYAYANPDTAYTKLIAAARVLSTPNQRLRYPAHVANILANSMEAYARAHPRDTTLVSSMFPLALYDLLGHFGRTDDDLRREFTINSATYTPMTPVPRAQAEYLRRRAAVKALVCPTLSGNGTCREQGTNIDIHAAVAAMRNYFHDPATILR